MKHFVFREFKSDNLTKYEIGECLNPRLFPEMWCDKRVCEGFWGDEDLARTTTTALNIAHGVYASKNPLFKGTPIRTSDFDEETQKAFGNVTP